MKVLVTGGAGFIGSHLDDALLAKGDDVTVVDNLVLGRKENIAHLLDRDDFHFFEEDLLNIDAMNKGWKMAKGDWIYYLGSDDELLPNGLLELIEQSRNPENFDIIYGNILYRKADNSVILHHHHSHTQLPWKTFACHQGLIMRRSVIERLGGFDEHLKIIADKDLIIRSYFLGDCRYKLTEATVAVFSGGGASSNYYNSFKEDLYIFRKVHPGFKYLLYVLQHYPRMWFRDFQSR